MPIRQAVTDFLAAGPLPDEAARVEAIQRSQDLLERIQGPVTDTEATAFLIGFGLDNCYGLSWNLLHLTGTVRWATAHASW